MVFTRPYCYCGGPLLGIGLAVTRDYVPPLFHLCLPCNACILGDYQGVFQGSFGWFGLFGPGAARAPKVRIITNVKTPLFKISNNYKQFLIIYLIV